MRLHDSPKGILMGLKTRHRDTTMFGLDSIGDGGTAGCAQGGRDVDRSLLIN